MHPHDSTVLARQLHQGVLLDRRVFDLLELDELRFAEYLDSIEFACGNMSRLHNLNTGPLRIAFPCKQ